MASRGVSSHYRITGVTELRADYRPVAYATIIGSYVRRRMSDQAVRFHSRDYTVGLRDRLPHWFSSPRWSTCLRFRRDHLGRASPRHGRIRGGPLNSRRRSTLGGSRRRRVREWLVLGVVTWGASIPLARILDGGSPIFLVVAFAILTTIVIIEGFPERYSVYRENWSAPRRRVRCLGCLCDYVRCEWHFANITLNSIRRRDDTALRYAPSRRLPTLRQTPRAVRYCLWDLGWRNDNQHWPGDHRWVCLLSVGR